MNSLYDVRPRLQSILAAHIFAILSNIEECVYLSYDLNNLDITGVTRKTTTYSCIVNTQTFNLRIGSHYKISIDFTVKKRHLAASSLAITLVKHF